MPPGSDSITFFTKCRELIWTVRTEVLFIQGVSDVYNSPFLDTDYLKMALRARKVSGAFENRAPGLEPGPLDP